MCWSFGVVGLEWYPCCRLKHSCASACNRNSDTHRTKSNTTNVVFKQNSCKLLMMDILMSKTCWAHKKWNKIASDIKLFFYSSTLKIYPKSVSKRQQPTTNLCSITFQNSKDVKDPHISRRASNSPLFELTFFLMKLNISFCSWHIHTKTPFSLLESLLFSGTMANFMIC